MKILKKIFFSVIFFTLLILINNKSEATTISIVPNEPKVGDTVTITVTVPNVHTTSVTANVSGAGVNGTIKVVGGDLGGQVKDYSNSSQFKCTEEGTISVEITKDSSAVLNGNYVDVSASKTVIVKKEESTPPTIDTGNTKSTEARLKNLGIKPNDFKGFKRDTTTYNVEVPNDVSKVNIYAEAVDSKATITGTGNVNLKEGSNTFKITVTAEAGNTKTYTLNITRVSTTDNTDDSEDEENNSEARLKNLGINPEEYDFSGFKKDTTSYSVEVPNEVAEIEVYAEAVSEKAKVEGTGKITLNEGLNKIEVKVTAEDGTEMVYTIEVTRVASTTDDEQVTNAKFGLSSLIIKNFSLSPKFDTETYEYTLGLREDLESLEIEAKANYSDAIIEIIGNENLKDGENIITILVSNTETEEYATYQIIVNKNTQSEVAGIVNWLEPSTWGLKEKIIIGVAILLIVVIIVAIIIKIRLAKKEDDDMDLPGADELDRALAEHQELADEAENEIQDEIEQNNNYKTGYNNYDANNMQEEKIKSDIEKAQEYFEAYTKRRGKHF